MPTCKRLIVSFLGHTDRKYWPYAGDDKSPLFRLLGHLFWPRSRFQFSETRLLLFYDSGPEKDVWEELVAKIKRDIGEYGWGDMEIKDVRIDFPNGPTDLDTLYSASWRAIRKSRDRGTKEEIFNITSGTPAMQACMILAADCLRLSAPRRFQMSREKNVEEIQLPWAIAHSPLAGRRGPYQRKPLPEKARKSLLPGTVLEDMIVEEEMAGLHEAATRKRRKAPARVLVKGPVGSGKWTAARQFAAWYTRDYWDNVSEWLEPSLMPEVVEHGCLLVRWLDEWTAEQLRTLSTMAQRRPDIAIVGTFRTNRERSIVNLRMARESLAGAREFSLPLPNERDDFSKLAEALVHKHEYLHGKLNEGIRYSLYQGVPYGLTGIEQILASAGSRSPGKHPDRTVVADEIGVVQAEDMLTECIQRIVAADYAPERKLPDILADLEKAAVMIALGRRRAKSDVEERIGIGRRKLTQIESRHWRLEK